MHTQVAQLIILAITAAVLIAIVWFGYRSHLKEQERESERWAEQLSRQSKSNDLNNLMRQATKKPEPSRPAPNFRDIGEDLLDPWNPLSPMTTRDQHSVSDYDERISRNHRHDPTPSYSHSDSSSFSSSSSSSDSGSCGGGCGGSD